MKLLIFSFILFSVTALGQIPEGYYDSAAGLSGQELRTALQDIIDDHIEQTYASIWTHFQSTDDDAAGKVWDMYSDVPGGIPAYTYTFIEDQCGNYAAEGDCYNREHSFPKSWFNDGTPILTDLFHIYPTDSFVNGKRSNYPYGEAGNASWTSSNGSRLGNCSYPGYSGVVFEPIDDYKGDFARTYFYMMTRYMDQVASWSSDMLAGNDLAAWAKDMLLEWDAGDPVSQKEIDRNNAVYLIQNNRNPFIDHPEYADQIWGLPSGLSHLNNKDLKVWYTRDKLHIINNGNHQLNMTIFNIIGQPVQSFQSTGAASEIPVELVSGIYFVLARTEKDSGIYKFTVTK